MDVLDVIDQKLVNSMDITYQPGKGNKLVPYIVPRDCVKAMNVLCSQQIRHDVGVAADNPFVCANTVQRPCIRLGYSDIHVLFGRSRPSSTECHEQPWKNQHTLRYP